MSDRADSKPNPPLLLVDDDNLQLKLMSRLFEKESFEPICCETGQAALDACRQRTVNVAIVDLHLPDMNGLELHRKLKIEHPDIKVIFHTGHASLDSAMAAINEEAFAYVEKTHLEQLLTHVHRAFHLHLTEQTEVLETEVRRRSEELLQANEELKKEIGEREQAEAALVRRAREMEALYETSLKINAQPDLSSLLQEIVRRATDLLGTSKGGLFLLKPDGESLEMVVVHNQPDSILGTTVGRGEGLSGRVIQSGEPLVVSDYDQWEGRVQALSIGRIGRILGVPLKRRDQVIGVLTVFDDDRTGDFEPPEIRLLSLFAAQAATAIENARLFETEREQRRLAEALRESGAVLSQTLDFEAVLDRILNQIDQVVPYDIAAVSLIEAGRSRVVRIRGHERFGKEIAENTVELSFDLATTENLHTMFETGQPMVIPDVKNYPGWINTVSFSHFRSWAGAPIKVQDRVIAFFSLDKVEPGFYQPSHAEQLAAFADQAAIALENARLFNQTEAALQETAVLFRVARTLAQVDNEQEMFELVLTEYLRHLNLKQGGVLLIDDDGDYVTLKAQMVAGRLVEPGLRIKVAGNPIYEQVLETQQPVVFGNAPNDAQLAPLRKLVLRLGITSLLLVPIVVRGDVIGALGADSTETPHAFTEREISLVKAMADQLAVAIENRRLYAETERRALQLATVNDLSREMAGLLDTETLYTTVCRRLCLNFDYFATGLFTLEPEAGEVVLTAVAGAFVDWFKPGQHRQSIDRGIIGRVARTGELMRVNDTRQAPEFFGPKEGIEIRSELAVPVKIEDRVLGVLNVDSDRFNAFDEGDVAVLTTVADQLAVSLEKVRLFVETRRRAEQLEALHQVSQDLVTLRDLDTLLRQIVERSMQLVSADTGGMYLYRPEQDRLEWVVGVGDDVHQMVGLTIGPDEGLSGRVWTTGEPQMVEDYQHWSDKLVQWSGIPIRAVIGVPIRWGDEFLGVLNQGDHNPRRFSPDDVSLLSQFATQAAVAIQNTRLLQKTQASLAKTEALHHVARSLIAYESLPDLLQIIADSVAEALLVDQVTLVTFDLERQQVTHFVNGGPGPGHPIVSFDELMAGLTGWAVRNLEPALSPKDRPDPRESLAVQLRRVAMNMGDVIVAPLTYRGQVLGTTTATNQADQRELTPQDVELMMAMNNQAAIAIDNARLYEQAQKDARTREVLLREVNHRVKNNLAAIVGLLYAEQEHAGSEHETRFEPLLSNLISRVRGLATVHDLLSASEWAPLQLSALTRQIIHSALQLLPSGKEVVVTVEPSPVRVTPAQAHNLALIINELATNSLKHAAPETTGTVEIGVRISLADDAIRFEFTDNGPGYPETVLSFDPHHCNVGFDLIQNLVRRSLRGRLTLANDTGACTLIEFKAEVKPDEAKADMVENGSALVTAQRGPIKEESQIEQRS